MRVSPPRERDVASSGGCPCCCAGAQIACAVMMLWLVAAGCGRSPPSAPPVLVLERDELDLGDVPCHEPQQVAVSLRNSGGEELRVTQLASSCQCSRPQISRSRIPPGESATMTLAIRPDAQGEQSAQLIIHSNSESEEDAQHTLTIRWRAQAPVELEPVSVDFGTLLPGATAQVEVRLLARQSLLPGKALCRIISSEGSGPELHYSATESEFRDQTAGPLILNCGQTAGEFSRRLRLQVGGGWSGVLELPVRWRVQALVTAVPPRLALGRGSPGTVVEGVVRLRALHEPLTISRIESSGKGWQPEVDFRIDTDSTAQLRIFAPLPQQSGVHRADMTIHYSQPATGTIVIPVSALVPDLKETP
jgi:hypothetical protein